MQIEVYLIYCFPLFIQDQLYHRYQYYKFPVHATPHPLHYTHDTFENIEYFPRSQSLQEDNIFNQDTSTEIIYNDNINNNNSNNAIKLLPHHSDDEQKRYHNSNHYKNYQNQHKVSYRKSSDFNVG